MEENKKFIKILKSKKMYKFFFEEVKIQNIPYNDPKDFFLSCWREFENFKAGYFEKHERKLNNSVPGQAFEMIVFCLLDREGLVILSMDENLKEVPLIRPDFILENNVFISCKTSLRERWKQADWEAIKYKEQFNQSKCFLLVNDYKESQSLKRKLDHIEIDEIFYAGSDDISHMINAIKSL